MNATGFPSCTTCGNTIRSRRCRCGIPQQYAPMNNAQMYYYRSHPDCNGGLNPTYRDIQTALAAPDMQAYDWSGRDYYKESPIDASDVYGSGLSRRNLAALNAFEDKVALMSQNAVWYGGPAYRAEYYS